jgi:hypothetical protein
MVTGFIFLTELINILFVTVSGWMFYAIDYPVYQQGSLLL